VKSRIIPRSFFRRDPITCARKLIGAELIWGNCAGTIVETEAYLAVGDEASHTFSRPTTRAFVERNQPGAAYIYFSYGAHWMLNVLVKGTANGFVLFRAVQPTRGIGLMKKRRGTNDERQLCSGPGKLTQAFAITNWHDEIDLCVDPRHCFAKSGNRNVEVVADLRIGITRSAHHPWRFTLRGSEFVSRAVRTETPSSKPQIPRKFQIPKSKK
jgi:DNA-3-methyladenine glycosylase